MKIYLVQHGKPVSKEENPEKPLSEQGRREVEKVAVTLKKAGVSVQRIYHSGKMRARQTADIMTSHLTPAQAPIERKGISPMDDVKETAVSMGEMQEDIMVVGHLPHLARLTAYLTTGDDSKDVVLFQQGGVVCLGRDEEKGWLVNWMLIPKAVPD